MTASEIYDSVTNGGASDFADVVAVLEHYKPWYLIGGLALKKFEHSMNAQRSGSKLNAQFKTDPRYQEFLEHATKREVLGMQVPVANLKDIVRGKVWAWQDEQRQSTKRKKDELDLMRIAEAHCELRPLIPAEIVKQL
jgi:hypothetical protein